MLWFTVFGIAQGAIIGLVAEPITDPQMWLFNLVAFVALIPALIGGVYWRAIVALSEKAVEAVREVIIPNPKNKKTVGRLVKVVETIDYYRTMEEPNMDTAIKKNTAKPAIKPLLQVSFMNTKTCLV